MSGLIPFGIDLSTVFNGNRSTDVQLRCIAQQDSSAYGIGDLLYDNGGSYAGVPMVSNQLVTPFQPTSPRTNPANFSVLLGPDGVLPQSRGSLAISTSAPALKSATYFIWVLPITNRREFDLQGDSSVPALDPNEGACDSDNMGNIRGWTQHVLNPQSVFEGRCFGYLQYNAPANGFSGVVLRGANLVTQLSGPCGLRLPTFGSPDVVIRGYHGTTLAPGGLWRVSFPAELTAWM